MTYHASTEAGLKAQRDTVLRCPCGGVMRFDSLRPSGTWGRCERCARPEVREDVVQACPECDALWESFDGPDAKDECPDCRDEGS